MRGIKASTLKVRTFRVTIKLTGDLTKWVYVLKPLNINLEGSKCKKMMPIQSLKSQGPKRKNQKIEDLVQKGLARLEAQGGGVLASREGLSGPILLDSCLP